jgi:hypothetical protein
MRILLCTLFLLVSSLALTAKATETSDLLKIDAAWNELRVEGNVDRLAQLLADDWLLTHSDGRTQTKSEYLNELSTRSRTNQAIVNEDVTLRAYDRTVVVTGVSIQSGVSNGTPWSGRFRFTRVWVHYGEHWKMVSSHSSRVTNSD